jgi:hypothetical protein
MMDRDEFDKLVNDALVKLGLSVSADDIPEEFDRAYELYADLPPECLERAIVAAIKERERVRSAFLN